MEWFHVGLDWIRMLVLDLLLQNYFHILGLEEV